MEKVHDSDPKKHSNSFPHLSYPWAIVLLSALLMMFSSLIVNIFGVFFKPIAEDFGWSRAAVAGAYALRSLVAAFFSLFLGYWSDRYGPRRVIVPCFAVLGVAFIITGRVSALWQFYLTQGVLIGIVSTGIFVIIMAVVSKWHTTGRGTALGITSAGSGLSSIVFPPLSVKLFEVIGWRGAIGVLGVMILVIAVPVAMFIKEPPEPVGVRAGRHGGPFQVWRSLPRLIKYRTFLAFVIMLLFFFITCNLMINHLVNYVTDAGISPFTAAAMMSVMGISSTLGRLAMGPISDRVGVKVDTIMCCAFVTLSLIALGFRVPLTMWIAVVLFGIGNGGAIPLVPLIMGEHFGTKHLATITGAAFLGVNLGNAIGPWMGGFIFDFTRSYLWALVLSVAFTTTALFIAVGVPSPTPQSQEKGEKLLE